MKVKETSLALIAFISSIYAYDNFQGIYQQKEGCFEVFDYPECNKSISDVFTPPIKMSYVHKSDTKLWLFTHENEDKAIELHRCGGQLPEDSKFDPQVDTIVVIHGYIDGVCRTSWMREFKKQFFKRSKYNVILVDWTWGNTFDVAAGGYNAVLTGQEVGFALTNIMKQMDINGDKIHLIGHSYGSVAASSCAKYLKKLGKRYKVRRLTGLDPPVITVNGLIPKQYVHWTDAKFVDCIHTSAGYCFPPDIGYPDANSHVDFYPNGGKIQPSCMPSALEAYNKGDFLYAAVSFLLPMMCNHLQALQYFKASINPPNGLFIGVKCNSYEEFLTGVCKRCCKEDGYDCAVFGMDAEDFYEHKEEPRQERKYFFHTNTICPFDEDYEFSVYKDCKKKK